MAWKKSSGRTGTDILLIGLPRHVPKSGCVKTSDGIGRYPHFWKKLSVGLKVEVKSILLPFTVPVIPSCDNLMEKYEIQHVWDKEVLLNILAKKSKPGGKELSPLLKVALHSWRCRGEKGNLPLLLMDKAQSLASNMKENSKAEFLRIHKWWIREPGNENLDDIKWLQLPRSLFDIKYLQQWKNMRHQQFPNKIWVASFWGHSKYF